MIKSLPGIGPFSAPSSSSPSAAAWTRSPDRLAASVGVIPAPCDSGKIGGNLHRPQR
ncbi:hypothetical protein [Streptomyces violaceusniger]|uniref:hypothetical protein n=1 Tax=Streptomyces violaceusniger TaxID=68280 RepID=UPI00138699B6